MPLFTRDNAREFALKANFIRWHSPKPEPEPEIVPQVPEPVADTTQTIELVRVRKRLDALDALMDAAETDKEWDNYSRSYERIFKAWCWLAGIPNPGSMRPSKATTTRRPTVSPIEPETPPIQ